MADFGYDEVTSDLVNNPEGIEFYVNESGLYTFGGNFNYLSIDTNPFKQKSKSVYLKKGVHVVAFDIPVSNPTITLDKTTYSLNGILKNKFKGANRDYSTLNEDGSLNYVDIINNPVSKQLSKYSDWIGCTNTCGYDSRTKYREVIPELYSVNDTMPTGVLELSEDCNKMCNSDESIFNLWKKVTSCPAKVMPPSTKEKFFADNIESALYIDNLKYSTDPTDLLSSWKTATTPLLSGECHGNSLENKAVLNRGARIYSSDSIGYLEYVDSGALSLMDVDGKETFKIRPAPSDASKKGDYCSLNNGVLQFFTNGIVVESKAMHSAECKFLINAFCIMVMDAGGFIVSILGETPSFLSLTSNVSEFRFRPGFKNYEILKVDTLTLSISSSGKISYVSNGIVLWESDLVPVGGQIVFGANGIRVYNAALVETIIAKASGVSKYSLSKESIELYSSEDYLVAAYGGKPSSMLTSNNPIRRPTMPEEHIYIKSGKGFLLFQSDGNLVFYRESNALWSTGTSGRPSTHFYLSANGEIFIMNGTSIVYRSNFSVPSTFAIILVTEDWCMICTKPTANGGLEVNRTLPNTTNLDAMKPVIIRHAEMIRDKLPAYTIKWSTHTGNTVGVPTSIPDISSLINSKDCGPGDVFCKYDKSKDANNKFTVNLSNATQCMSYSSGEASSITDQNSIYSFNDMSIIGYEPLFLDKYLGLFSTPYVNINGKAGVVMIKKDITEFAEELASSASYRNLVIVNNALMKPVMTDLLSLGGDLTMSSNFSMKSDSTSGFGNPIDDILQSRKDMLELNCNGDKFSAENCAELSYLSPDFYKGYLTESFSNKGSWSILLFILILVVVCCFVVVFFARKKTKADNNE